MNEVAVRQTTALAPISDDPFADFAQEAGQRSIVGQLLKFSKGDWLVGESSDEIPIGTQFVANMGELLRGWVRWQDNKPTDHVMGKVMLRYQPPRRNELGDLDKSQWEVDDKGNERDPWQETYYLLLKGYGDGNDDELFTFAASSKGGRDAIADLSNEFSKGKRRQKGEVYPIVAIGTGFYLHKEFGRIKTPEFKIVGWVPTSIFDDVGNGDGEGVAHDGAENVDPETGEVTTGGAPASTDPAPAPAKAAKTETGKAETAAPRTAKAETAKTETTKTKAARF